jgi:hypothetical protein
MLVVKVGENCKCNIFGNEVVITMAGGRALIRCREDPRLYTSRPLVGEWPPSPGR